MSCPLVSGLQPCHLKDWEMHVQFKVHGSGKKNLHGDGIALWYTKDRLHTGNVNVLSGMVVEGTGAASVVVGLLKFGFNHLSPCCSLVPLEPRFCPEDGCCSFKENQPVVCSFTWICSFWFYCWSDVLLYLYSTAFAIVDLIIIY